MTGAMPDDLLGIGRRRQRDARRVLDELALLPRWARHGDPHLVGSQSLGVAVRPDIDLEVHTPGVPRIEEGFALVAETAALPRVRRARFRNELFDGDPALPQGLYWKLECLDDSGEWWSIDTWVLEEGREHRCTRELTRRLAVAMTDAHRSAVIRIKLEASRRGERPPALAVYQAVLEAEIGDLQSFSPWLREHASASTNWMPPLPHTGEPPPP